MRELTAVEATGRDSSDRESAKYKALEALGRELHRQKLEPVGSPTTTLHGAGPGRFCATARVQARKR